MKITILISDITRTGGTERSVVTLANMLHKSNYEVTIASLTKSESENIFYSIEPEISIRFLDNTKIPNNFIKKIVWCISTVFLLRKFNRSNSSDFFMATGHNFNWLLPFIKTNKKTKTVACEHIVYDSIPNISKFFMSMTYRYIDHIVVLSEKAKVSYSKYSKVSIIPNALPFESKTQSLLINPEIILVGRLSPEKGLERLVIIGKIIKQNYPNWKIVLVGDGDIRENLKGLYKEAGLENFIEFKGVIKDMKQAYLNASIYIMTSRYEAFPMVLLEAQSCGLPIVSFDCPEGPSQIIHNDEDGYLIEDDDYDTFTEQLMKLMENHDLRKKMGEQSYKNSKLYSVDSIIKKWDLLFKK